MHSAGHMAASTNCSNVISSSEGNGKESLCWVKCLARMAQQAAPVSIRALNESKWLAGTFIRAAAGSELMAAAVAGPSRSKPLATQLGQ